MTDRLPPERALTFACADATLVGIVHEAAAAARRGVLIVVGGPQYRAGSHRQFLLLGRSLAEHGVPTMRFDHRGIGDSEGPYRGFDALQDDIAAAIEAFHAECPAIEEVVLWGLCDAASAILFYAHRDSRVAGVVLANPWVRTPQSEARAYLRHYYLLRLAQPDFWRNVLVGRLNPVVAAHSLIQFVGQLRSGPAATDTGAALPDLMAEGLARFSGPVLLVLSGQDLTAREFEDAVAASPEWRRLLGERRVRHETLVVADHTFSRRQWRDKVADWTLDWLHSW